MSIPLSEMQIREIVRDEIAKALRDAEIEGPHMRRLARSVQISVVSALFPAQQQPHVASERLMERHRK